jgi:hypothetical protein
MPNLRGRSPIQLLWRNCDASACGGPDDRKTVCATYNVPAQELAHNCGSLEESQYGAPLVFDFPEARLRLFRIVLTGADDNSQVFSTAAALFS